MEQFTYVKRGYDPEEVDKYIATLEQVIKSYKDKDNAIKNAIISAQVAADNMIKNAKAQADEYKGQIAKELDKVSLEVDRQRMRIRAFQDVYTNLVRKYLAELENEDIMDLYARLDDVDKLVTRLKEIDIMPAPTPGDMPRPTIAFQSGIPVNMGPPPQSPPVLPPLPPGPSDGPPHHQQVPHLTPQPGQQAPLHAPVPPKPPLPPPLSLGPSTSPSLNKSPAPYAPPQVVARINDDGNYVPNS